jgi:putative membrane protein
MRPATRLWREAHKHELQCGLELYMTHSIHGAFESCTLSISLGVILILEAFIYLCGWARLRSARVTSIPAWRAGSFLLGLFLIWLAVGSSLTAFDETLLTVHMIQHLLLMTFAPALILMGAPVMPLLHGLPRNFVQTFLAPLFRYPPLQRAGHFFSQPAFCWIAAAAALLGWHTPPAFTLALQSEAWHAFEHSSFLVAGLLFWWPVIQPWPSVPHWARWSVLLYLFLATLPCDILSAYLTFCDRLVYPVYLNTPRPFGISALADQECAGALMWTCITIVYLLPAAILTIRLLETRASPTREAVPSTLSAWPSREERGRIRELANRSEVA